MEITTLIIVVVEGDRIDITIMLQLCYNYVTIILQ